MAPMWFCKDLEKDKVFRPNRDTLCLQVNTNGTGKHSELTTKALPLYHYILSITGKLMV
jgi:hypothetical protein